MKIGFIGAESTGKTSAARLLAPMLGIPLIEELVRDLCASWGCRTPADVPDVRVAQRAYLDAQAAKQMSMGPSYVSDRTTLDNAAYMLQYAAPTMPLEDVRKFLEDAKLHVQPFDLLVYFPIAWDVVEDDGFRNTDPALRREVGDIIWQLVLDFELRAKTYVVREEGVQPRVREILREMTRMRLI